MERQPFNRQPARAVIIDLQLPMDPEACLNIKEALHNVLAVLAHLAGPCRLPLLSLSVIHSYTECLLPLQPLRGSFPRVQAALGELASLAQNLVCQRGQVRSSLLDGIQEALTQFRNHTLSLKQGLTSSTSSSLSYPSQIEVTLLTAQSPPLVRQYIERVVDHLDLQHLKKISAVCINSPERLIEQCGEGQESPVQEGSLSQNQPSPSELGLSILDLMTCDNDCLSLEMMLRSWLKDCNTDSEHLHLLLPPSSSKPVVLKCDLHDRILHPSLLPSLTKHFLLTTGSNDISGPPSTPGMNRPVAIHKLKAVGFVQCDGICESVVYGTPVIVSPTACWKLDWEELETNQQYFQALCHIMKNKNQAMVACSVATGSAPEGPPLPVAHYILLPSPSSQSLLLKSIAVNELLLPLDWGQEGEGSLEQPLPEILDTLGGSLSKLTSSDCYNPLLMCSNLHKVVSVLSNKRIPVSRSGGDQSKRGGRGRGRGVSPGGLREVGPTKRKQPQKTPSTAVDGTSRGSSRSLGPKRLRIMRGDFVYGCDHVTN